MDFDHAALDRWITREAPVTAEAPCLGCREMTDGDCLDANVLCPDCGTRFATVLAASHADCDCADCVWIAGVHTAIAGWRRYCEGPDGDDAVVGGPSVHAAPEAAVEFGEDYPDDANEGPFAPATPEAPVSATHRSSCPGYLTRPTPSRCASGQCDCGCDYLDAGVKADIATLTVRPLPRTRGLG